MAIALTEFEGLCGFRPVEEIISFLKSECDLKHYNAPQYSSAVLLARYVY